GRRPTHRRPSGSTRTLPSLRSRWWSRRCCGRARIGESPGGNLAGDAVADLGGISRIDPGGQEQAHDHRREEVGARVDVGLLELAPRRRLVERGREGLLEPVSVRGPHAGPEQVAGGINDCAQLVGRSSSHVVHLPGPGPLKFCTEHCTMPALWYGDCKIRSTSGDSAPGPWSPAPSRASGGGSPGTWRPAGS